LLLLRFHLPMRLAAAFFVFLYIQVGNSYKFLAYSPQFAVSHVNFIAKISDALVDAGHEVVIVAPRVNPAIRGAGTKKARVIELPENEFSQRWQAGQERVMDLYWNSSWWDLAMEMRGAFDSIYKTVNATMTYPGLVEQLRQEKFDAAFSELQDPAGFGLFHLAGIDKLAITVSFTSLEFRYECTHMPTNPSYVPAIASPYGDSMSFLQRIPNFLMSAAFGSAGSILVSGLQPIFEAIQPGFPSLHDVIGNNSLVFINSEPLLDYPRPTVHRVIEIGGIVTATKALPLNDYWSDVLNRRNNTVILSFGTYIKASTMPGEYKSTIRHTLAKFPDVTFIWKYESPEHNISAGIDNIVESTWLPQVDLLNDSRLSGFITHGGQGSTLEAAFFGTPMLMVPTQGDQFRNAAMIKRAGL
ncbi:hypothetical protein PFISCL1PPCAC_14122, partial [Pristionchus fissidentatus]